ncbi:MAG: hypothetical protein EA425_01480 [Puniceicoccaceae bacterium]|nr:MAG: hypothetical protein EA425_01480 [Puniceicoccaceae bacterium]
MGAVSLSAQTTFINFEDLSLGPINGQDGWSYNEDRADRLPSDGILVNLGSLVPGGMQHLDIPAARNPAQRQDRFLERPYSIGTGNTYISFAVNMIGDSGADNPNEFFFRFAGWGSYVAMKIPSLSNPMGNTDGETRLEAPGVSLNVPLSIGQTYRVVVKLSSDGDTVNSMDVWLDPDIWFGEVPVGPSLFSTSISAPVANFNLLEIRSQNSPTLVDDIRITIPEPSTYAFIFGAFALAGVMAWKKLRS